MEFGIFPFFLPISLCLVSNHHHRLYYISGLIIIVNIIIIIIIINNIKLDRFTSADYGI